MMKKVWPVLLAVVLVSGLAMLGCKGGGDGGGGPVGGGGETVENPIAEGASFLRITNRVNNWDGIDIKTVADNASGYTADKKHTITVYGKTEGGETVSIEQAAAGYSKLGEVNAGADGSFELTKEFTWAQLNEATNKNLRIKVTNSKSYDIYEVTIVDEAGASKYKMSEDEEIQALEAGETQFFKEPGATDGSTWFWKAGTPKIIVMVPGEEGGEGGGEEPGMTDEEKEAAFAAAVGIKGLTQASSGNNIVIDTDTGIISRAVSNGYGSWVSVAIPAASLTPAIIASDTIVVSYIGIGNANIIPKLENSTDSVNPAMYATLIGDGTVRTLEIPAVRYGLTFPTAVWTFQGNNSSETAWKVKITDITVRHGDPIQVGLAIPLKAPVGGLPPSANVDTIQYTGAVVWTPTIATNFVTGTPYTATITLTKRAGYTFEGIAADTFTVSGATTVTHAAGTAGDTIVVTAVFPNTVAPPEKTVTFTTGDVKSVAATITDVTATGFTMEQTANYGNSYAYFKVKFADGFKLSNYSKIDCKLTLIGTTYKPLCVMAFADEPSGWQNDNTIIAGDTSSNAATEDNTETPVTLTIGAVGAGIDLNEVWIAIRSNANSGTKYKITDIKFYN